MTAETRAEGRAAARLVGICNVDDARRRARRTLPRGLFDYIDGGAEDERTLARNGAAFAEWELRPRSGAWVPEPDLGVSVLGESLSMPVLTAPCGGMRLVHPYGDKAVVAAAHQAGIVPVVTTAAQFSLEEIAEAPAPRWFQLYSFSSRPLMEELVHRAARAGYGALVVTIDTSVSGNRERDFRNGFSYDMRIDVRNAARMAPQMLTSLPWLRRYMRDGMPFEIPNTSGVAGYGAPMRLTELAKGGEGASHSPSWDDIGWIRQNWSGPLVVKGVLTAETARRAVRAGADAVVVSNHGGRQLDGVPASIDVLPEVVAEVGSEVEVLLDSGIRRGTDVAKAVALGARAVLVGRLPVWGLATGGQPGVTHQLEILRRQLAVTMQLLGATTVSELGGGLVQNRSSRPLLEGRLVEL